MKKRIKSTVTRTDKKKLAADHNASYVHVPFDHAENRKSAHPGTKGRIAPPKPFERPYTLSRPNPLTEARNAKAKLLKKRMAIHRSRFTV
jgi:hypothetical protein